MPSAAAAQSILTVQQVMLSSTASRVLPVRVGWLLVPQLLFSGMLPVRVCKIAWEVQDLQKATKMALFPLALVVIHTCCAAALPSSGIIGEPVCLHFAPVPCAVMFFSRRRFAGGVPRR